MKAFFKYFMLAAALIVLVSITFAAEKKPPSADSALLPSENIWFYGMVPKDAWVSHHYVLTNPHKDTVTITEIVPGCDCTHAPKPPISIAPGESYVMPTTFDTRTYFGETNRDIHIVTDYEPNPTLDIYFSSLVARQPSSVEVSPASSVFVQGVKEREFTIRNLTDEKADVVVLVDHDSSLVVSEGAFTLEGRAEKTFTVKPVWEKFTIGESYATIVLEIRREQNIRVTIPIKVNKF